MVARSILGDSISRSINLCLLIFESFNWFLSVGLSAKKPISEPEIRPEKINNTIQDMNGVKKL